MLILRYFSIISSLFLYFKAETGGPNITLTFRWTLKTIYAAFFVAMWGKCMAGTVDIVRYIYIWQATPACPEKGTTLVETAPLDWFLKWLEAVTAASAKYALNAQSVRNALRLPGKKGEGQAKWAGLLCVNMLSNSRKDLGF